MVVNKDTLNTENWRISDLASHMPEEIIPGVEPQGDGSVSPSFDRIKQLALEKRQDNMNGKEEKPVKKTSFKIILIAAMVGLMSITAFAAFGGLEYIKSIFGDSAQSIQNEIVTPQVKASADDRDMALEALVTDGYVTNMVVSLTGDRPSDQELFTVSTGTSLRSNGWYVLEDFTTSGKTFYVVDLVSEQRFDTADITLSLNRDVAPIDLTFQIENKLGNAVVDFPEGSMSGQTQLKELQVSPMGFLLICHEENPQGGLPTTNISLVFSNGKTEVMEVEFAPSDETVGGGGGAIIDNGPKNMPLVVTFYGNRNPDGELIISGQFSRIINPAEIQKVIIDGVGYQVN